MHDDESIRFTPESLGAFTAAARDLGMAFGLSLSLAQETLARIYGFEDFHEIREALRQRRPPGPYRPQTTIAADFNREHRILEVIREYVSPDTVPIGRRGPDDLHLFDRPQERRRNMRFQDGVERELDPGYVAIAHGVPVDAYAYFDTFQLLEGRSLEGRFYQTALGRQIELAVRYLRELREWNQHQGKALECDRLNGEIERVLRNHPNNPYAQAMYVCEVAGEREEFRDRETALWVVEIAKRGVALFDALMPEGGFRGEIHPKSVGSGLAFENWIDNWHYSAILYWGGLAAGRLGDTKTMRKWMNRCYRACRSYDCFGARFVLGKSSHEEELGLVPKRRRGRRGEQESTSL